MYCIFILSIQQLLDINRSTSHKRQCQTCTAYIQVFKNNRLNKYTQTASIAKNFHVRKRPKTVAANRVDVYL